MTQFQQNQFTSGVLAGAATSASWEAPLILTETNGSLEPTSSAQADSEQRSVRSSQQRPASVFVGRGMPDPRKR
jgi:hypothetical protein